MQRPPANKAPLQNLAGEPTQEEKDAAASLISFDESSGVTVTPQVFRAAPQKVPRIPRTAPQKATTQTSPQKETTPAPSTPKKKKPEAVSNATEATVGNSPRSPQKMENGKPAYMCHSMVEVGPAYFSKDYLERRNYPTNCSTCKLKLLAGRKTKGETGITRVTGTREVKICQNALNHRDHECVHCLCHDCHSQENASGGRKMRKRTKTAGAEPGQKKKRKKGANP